MNTEPIMRLVDSRDIQSWPYCPPTSRLWDLDHAIDVSRLVSENDKANSPVVIEYFDELMGWMFDLMSAYYVLATFTSYAGPVASAYYIRDRLTAAKFRPSPLLNGPEHLEDSALVAYRMLVKRYRSPSDRLKYLMRSMIYVACLSEGEAESCIRAYYRKDEYACEAVAHYGGSTAVIERAVKFRHRLPRLDEV